MVNNSTLDFGPAILFFMAGLYFLLHAWLILVRRKNILTLAEYLGLWFVRLFAKDVADKREIELRVSKRVHRSGYYSILVGCITILLSIIQFLEIASMTWGK